MNRPYTSKVFLIRNNTDTCIVMLVGFASGLRLGLYQQVCHLICWSLFTKKTLPICECSSENVCVVSTQDMTHLSDIHTVISYELRENNSSSQWSLEKIILSPSTIFYCTWNFLACEYCISPCPKHTDIPGSGSKFLIRFSLYSQLLKAYHLGKFPFHLCVAFSSPLSLKTSEIGKEESCSANIIRLYHLKL